MNDREFLIWIHCRLTDVYGESPLIDWLHKLRAIIKHTPPEKNTPDIGSGNSIKDLEIPSFNGRETYVVSVGGEEEW